ncbi:MAG: signal peptidase I [Chthoniobacterales bacterium]|nr:signal peptidase I [Chthoniobacterales bacterium]
MNFLFFTPRYLTQSRELYAAAHKLFQYHCDLWNENQQRAAEQALKRLREALHLKQEKEVLAARQEVEALFTQLVPPRPYQGLAENIESLVIAIVLAVGFQATLLKPFRIPTGSMQPTLYGVTGHPETKAPPSLFWRAMEFVRLGRSYIHCVAKEEGAILQLEEHTLLNFFTFTKVTTTQGTYTLFAPRDVLWRDFNVRPGRLLSQGEIIAHGYVQAGDQIFCDRITYAFQQPKAGDPFVFTTSGIQRIEMLHPESGSQYYVKRLAGIPGETLQIDPPRLLVNGSIPTKAPFLRVISQKNGYQGYSNESSNGDVAPYLGSPEDRFVVPPHSYFALGDNSYNSWDSRYWGIVLEQNVVGRAFFVYWPFSSRWGLIH